MGERKARRRGGGGRGAAGPDEVLGLGGGELHLGVHVGPGRPHGARVPVRVGVHRVGKRDPQKSGTGSGGGVHCFGPWDDTDLCGIEITK